MAAGIFIIIAQRVVMSGLKLRRPMVQFIKEFRQYQSNKYSVEFYDEVLMDYTRLCATDKARKKKQLKGEIVNCQTRINNAR